MSAAEASGDEHAARLMRALRARVPDAKFIGVAGPEMASEGCEVVADLTARASMVGGPLLQLGYYYRTVRRIRRAIGQIKPDIHIPVDSPALNWHLAAEAKAAGAKVFYYIAPQVWAWAPWRVKKLARLTDQVACILPFEQRYLRDRGVNATFVGHPLFEDFPPRPDPLPDLAGAWSDGTFQVAMLPGSRPGEIKGHAAALAFVAKQIRRRFPKARCVFTARTENCAQAMHAAADGHEIDVVAGNTRQVLSRSHFAVAASGTVTLEVAYYGVPMVIFYRASRLAYNALGRWLIQLPYLSLVNILAGRRLVPELMPWHGSKRQLAKTVLDMIDDLGCLYETRQALLDLTTPLVTHPPHTASQNAAELVAKMLGR